MRTTVSISDELLAAARAKATMTGQTLGALVERALRKELAQPTPSDEDRPLVPVFRGGTGPQPGLDLTSNSALHEALDEGLGLQATR